MEKMKLIAKTFQGLEEVLAQELTKLGAEDIKQGNRVVYFTGDKEIMYRANFELRTAVRILKPITTFEATNADEVYNAVKEIDWTQYLDLSTTFAVDSVVYSEDFRNSKFVSYKVKDAIVDFFREKTGQRPNISVASPDIKFNVHISDKSCTLSLDSSGESLHKRGYRQASVESPINEVLAAAMIMMTGWDGECDFIDPMCGSGTLLIEAALIARNMAPGIFRKNYAFEKWKDFDAELFEKIYNDDSKEREFTHHIYGYDQDWEAIAAAMQNVKAAGVTSDITLTVQPIQKFTQPEEKAIMVTNPPYGERISSPNLLSLYRTIGEKLKHQFVGNEAWIIGYREETFDNIGLRPSLKVSLYNGALNCTFCKYSIFSGRLNEFRSQGGVMKSDEERHRNAERKIFKPRREHVQNENTEFMEEDEIPDFIIRRHNEFVANQRREAHRSRREEDSRERKDYKKEYSSHSDRPRKDDEQKFSGPKRPFDKGRGGGFKKNFGSHSKGGFQRRGKED
ncbi:MAG TPA: RNA methyltransferase [Prevotellaceae bacterium]|jgi:putative N6-adenine-specific DNA methylase|nr:RNA methyltransferase [Prevotellaceae bacterium]